MFAKKFNQFFEPRDLKSAYKFNYLLGSGLTFLGFSQGAFWGDALTGIVFVAGGQLLTGLAFDYRNERIENGYDALKERVEELEG
jgi:hypothetical protein